MTITYLKHQTFLEAQNQYEFIERNGNGRVDPNDPIYKRDASGARVEVLWNDAEFQALYQAIVMSKNPSLTWQEDFEVTSTYDTDILLERFGPSGCDEDFVVTIGDSSFDLEPYFGRDFGEDDCDHVMRLRALDSGWIFAARHDDQEKSHLVSPDGIVVEFSQNAEGISEFAIVETVEKLGVYSHHCYENGCDAISTQLVAADFYTCLTDESPNGEVLTSTQQEIVERFFVALLAIDDSDSSSSEESSLQARK